VLHNPAVQATVWQGSKHLPKNYVLRLPNDMLSASLPQLMVNLPADARFDKQLPDLFHTIGRGDTLSQIADRYDTSVSTLVALNNLNNRNRIMAGQRLRLPAAGPAPVQVAAAPAPQQVPASIPAQVPVPVAASSPPPPAAVIEDAPAIGGLPEPVASEADVEVVPFVLADEVGQLIGDLQSSLLSDPSDYTIAEDSSIEVQPLETLGHYADWLGIKTQRLRDINGLAFRTPVEVGQRIKLDLGRVNAESFENLRAAYHKEQQDTFFRDNRITGVTEHVVSRGESVWILALRKYDVPVWLFRQYNPELDLHNVQRGTRLNFPILVSNTPG
jgi:membrane-bound lytic murein transglycosylase D